MVDAVTVVTKKITRNKLAQVFRSQELIKAFEDLTQDVSITLPAAVNANLQAAAQVLEGPPPQTKLELGLGHVEDTALSTWPGSTNITTLGTITTGAWKATPLTAAFGGTGLTSYAVGDLLYASGVAALSRLADVATGNVLLAGGVGVAPSWGQVGLTTHVTGILPVSNGGTGTGTAFTPGSVVFAGASGAYSQNNSNLFWDDTNKRLGVGTAPSGAYTLAVAGALQVSSATLIASATTLTNGAGAASATLTNAPAAGNPTKWVPINDNGTTRYIPSW